MPAYERNIDDKKSTHIGRGAYYRENREYFAADDVIVNASIPNRAFLFRKNANDLEEKINDVSNYVVVEKIQNASKVDLRDQIDNEIEIILTLLKSLKTEECDVFEIEEIFANIMKHHDKLWNMRANRETPFAAMVTLLESCLRYYDSGSLTTEKINFLDRTYKRLKVEIPENFPIEYVREFKNVGFDVLRPLREVKRKVDKN